MFTLKVKVRKLEDGFLYGVSEDHRFCAIAQDNRELKQLMQKETSMRLEFVPMYGEQRLGR